MCRSSESRLESCFPHAVHVHCGGRAGLRTIAKRLTGLPGSRFDMHQLFHTSRERSIGRVGRAIAETLRGREPKRRGGL